MILFRCDANPKIGLGHLTRCRALAASLSDQGYDCMMLGPPLTCREAGDAALFRSWITLPWLDNPAADAAELVSIAAHYQATAIVLDDMRVDESYQQVIRTAGLRWLQFDGARGQNVWADVIVNANPAATTSYYFEYAMNPEAVLLLGPAYAVLRPQFRLAHLKQDEVCQRRVLLMFGGGDDRGAIRFTIDALHPALPEDIVFDIVAGRQNPNHEVNKEFLATLPAGRAHYHIDPPMLPAIMRSSAVAVLAGGTTTYEANLFGIPMVLITIADNQIAQARAWETRGQAIYVGEIDHIDPQCVAQATINQLERKTITPRLVDGQGAARVAAELTSHLSESESRDRQVTL
jgi:UDP-2,4-diacetamido-2,4,6-trideoxy-beta-L-altropyranose hydrolase